MKLTKKIIERIEKETNCCVEIEDKELISVFVDNSCDEDFRLEINRGKNELEDIICQCDCYDSDEHFRLWFGANNGEPQSPRDLLDNCEEIGRNLEQLGDLLRGIVYGNRD